MLDKQSCSFETSFHLNNGCRGVLQQSAKTIYMYGIDQDVDYSTLEQLPKTRKGSHMCHLAKPLDHRIDNYES